MQMKENGKRGDALHETVANVSIDPRYGPNKLSKSEGA